MKLAPLGCTFGLVLWVLVLICSDGGHGTCLPLAIFGAPFS